MTVVQLVGTAWVFIAGAAFGAVLAGAVVLACVGVRRLRRRRARRVVPQHVARDVQEMADRIRAIGQIGQTGTFRFLTRPDGAVAEDGE